MQGIHARETGRSWATLNTYNTCELLRSPVVDALASLGCVVTNDTRIRISPVVRGRRLPLVRVHLHNGLGFSVVVLHFFPGVVVFHWKREKKDRQAGRQAETEREGEIK